MVNIPLGCGRKHIAESLILYIVTPVRRMVIVKYCDLN
jgi:hypothetical protein